MLGFSAKVSPRVVCNLNSRSRPNLREANYSSGTAQVCAICNLRSRPNLRLPCHFNLNRQAEGPWRWSRSRGPWPRPPSRRRTSPATRTASNLELYPADNLSGKPKFRKCQPIGPTTVRSPSRGYEPRWVPTIVRFPSASFGMPDHLPQGYIAHKKQRPSRTLQ